MTPYGVDREPRTTRRLGALVGPLLIVSLALGGGLAGCTDHATSSPDAPAATTPAPASVDASAPWPAPSSDAPALAPAPASAEAPVPIGHMHMPTANEVTATWKVRPDYVRALPPDWQGAYAYALARPDVLQWLPCYCGCTGMGHKSNLDCFFQRREVEGFYAYEEHASYCDICVETANLASEMLRQGSTMVQVRAAVDDTFGGRAPGTETSLPPF